MNEIAEDSNKGRRALIRQSVGPFGGKKGKSKVMSKSAHTHNRSRGLKFETTIHKDVSQHELDVVIKRLDVHRKSKVGSTLYIVFGGERLFLGSLADLTAAQIKAAIKKHLEKYGSVGLEVCDAKSGGALHMPGIHQNKFRMSVI